MNEEVVDTAVMPIEQLLGIVADSFVTDILQTEMPWESEIEEDDTPEFKYPQLNCTRKEAKEKLVNKLIELVGSLQDQNVLP